MHKLLRMGLVANGGGDYTRTFTGWTLKKTVEVVVKNNILTGLTYILGKWQIAPNFLWQKPLGGSYSRR
ncbi:MAG: hypothetical protein U5K54_00010 [Cytophagales bacterium]|nr:hypothetical protein [Cytophagales bacterium]